MPRSAFDSKGVVERSRGWAVQPAHAAASPTRPLAPPLAAVVLRIVHVAGVAIVTVAVLKGDRLAMAGQVVEGAVLLAAVVVDAPARRLRSASGRV